MPAPATGAELHIDTPLSNILVNRRPGGFIADSLLPVSPVSKRSDIYWKFRYREWFRYQAGLSDRAPGTEPRKVGVTVTSDTYYAKNYALGAEWVVEDEVNADEILQWRTTNTEILGDRLMMDYEMRVAALAVNTSNVGTVTTISSQWSDPAVAKAFDDIMNTKEQFRLLTGQMPNLVVCPQAVWTYLQRNDQFRGRIFGQNNGGVPTEAQIAQLIGVEKFLIPTVQVNTASDYATELGSGTLSDVWGKHFWMAKVNPLQGRQVDTWLNAFRWTSPLFGQPMAVQAIPFDPVKLKYQIFASYYQDEKVVSPDLAIRIAGVVA